MINIKSTSFDSNMINLQLSAPEMMVVLKGGHVATKTLYDSIRGQVEEILPAITADFVLELKQMCDANFWERLSETEQQTAGRCMVNMVTNGILPLDFVGCKHKTPKTYCRKQDSKKAENCTQH